MPMMPMMPPMMPPQMPGMMMPGMMPGAMPGMMPAVPGYQAMCMTTPTMSAAAMTPNANQIINDLPQS